MGHVEPEGAVEACKPRRLKPWQKGPLADNRLWALWQETTALYSFWRSLLASLSPRSPFRRETSYFWFDVILGLRAMWPSRAVVARLESVSDHELSALIALGEINSRRQEHFFRSLVLAYITVPLTVGAIWAQLSPATLLGVARNPELAAYWGGGIAGLASAVVIRFVADWRARSFLSLLQMAQAERKVSGSEPRSPPA